MGHRGFIAAPSIEAALALARQERRKPNNQAAIVIEIARGVHRLAAPVRFGPEDSGTPTLPLIIRGARDGGTRITASFPLVGGDEPAPSLLTRLPAEARDHVRVYHLPDAAARAPRADVIRRHSDLVPPPPPFEIFDGTGALLPARWPNDGWASVTGAADDEDSADFSNTDGRMYRWRDEPDLWAAGYWKWNWSYETRPISTIDPDRWSISLAEPSHYGIIPGARFFIYHALSELDRPGEWVRTPDRRSVILWPRESTGDIEATVGENLFILDGARHIRFEGLRLGRTRGDAVRIVGGAGIVVADSVIAETGGRGIVFDGARRSGIERSVVTGTGGVAVELSGGNRAQLVPGGLFVTGSLVSRAGRLGRTYQPAIRVSGVGNAVVGNMIADLPHAAIVFSGNDHLIELNEITRVVRETSDAGAIYTGRDWTARGTVIRNNFLHDIRGRDGFETKGIYLDDMASGIDMEGNLFLRVGQPVFIGGGRDNRVIGNLMVASEPAIHIDARGTGWSRRSVDDADSELRRNLVSVPYLSPSWRERYPTLAPILEHRPGMPVGNRSRGNVLVGSSLYDLEGGAREVATGLGPDFAASTSNDAAAAAIIGATSARDIGRLIAATASTVPWPDLPFGRMDRAGVVPDVQQPVN